MTIAELLRNLDDVKSTVAYPMKQIYSTSSGSPVIGLNAAVQTLVRSGQPLVEPIQVVRRPGLGDKVFALAATYAYLQEHPDADVTFSGLDTDSEWMSNVIDWVRIGVNPDCNTVVNLDNTPCNGGDRTRLMGEALGVDVVDMSFPIRVPRKNLGIKKPYYVLVPFAARQGPRSLPMKTVLEILQRPNLPLVVTDSLEYAFSGMASTVTNATGMKMLDLISLIEGAAGVVSVDSGVAWLACAMSKPVLVLGGHVASEDRTMTTSNMLWTSPQCSCFRGCGDHVGTTPQCRFKEAIPACMQRLTTDFVRFQMREFGKIT